MFNIHLNQRVCLKNNNDRYNQMICIDIYIDYKENINKLKYFTVLFNNTTIQHFSVIYLNKCKSSFFYILHFHKKLFVEN